ncbi:hypothetical protein METHP14_10351 [Pseudomonas sp. P14-2025]
MERCMQLGVRDQATVLTSMSFICGRVAFSLVSDTKRTRWASVILEDEGDAILEIDAFGRVTYGTERASMPSRGRAYDRASGYALMEGMSGK